MPLNLSICPNNGKLCSVWQRFVNVCKRGAPFPKPGSGDMNAGEAIRRARSSRGLTQIDLAARAGISRKALGAIESGSYQPGVSVALSLARELGESVENLVGATADDNLRHIAASWGQDDISSSGSTARTRVALGRVGGKLIAVTQAAARLTLVAGGGILEHAAHRRAEVSTFLSKDEIDATLLIAGCDPAVAILADWLARARSPVAAISLACSSKRALAALLAGRVHAAGMHLRDARNGEYNLSPVRHAFGKRHAAVILIHFGQWELGLATAANNPLKIGGFGDLERPKLRIVHRELGSGARAALDED